MVLWDSIVEAALGKFAPSIVGHYTKKMELKHQIEEKKLEGKIAWEMAKTKRAEASEGRDHDWEMMSIQNSGWKDELVLIVLTIPMILVFIPGFEVYVAKGFDHLAETPEWYRWLIMMIYAATFGIRIWRRKI